MIRRIVRCVPLLAFLVFSVFSISVQAQISNGTIRGTVTDSTGAVLPQATVELVRVETQATLTDLSNKEGYYSFTALSPGDYKVKVSAPGFAGWEGKLTLRVAQEAVIDASLKTGSVSSTVTVTDVTPLIDKGDGTLSDVKEATRIETLPLQNRNFLNILNFSPGVVANGFAGQGAGYTRVNGITGGSMDYQVDGQSAVDRFTNEVQSTPQAVPTIQEIKSTTSNGGAEYSRPGVVEIVTKSGTNAFHGQVFELYQGSSMQAKIFRQQTVKHLVHNEFGGQFGGPLLLPKLYNGRNKTFFFFDVEQVLQNAKASETYSLPLRAWKTGDFSTFVDPTSNSTGLPVTIYDPATTTKLANGTYTRTAFPGNKIPAARINKIASLILLKYLPDPNVAGTGVDYWDNPNYQNPNAVSQDNRRLITGKVDQLLGRSRLSGRYTYTNAVQPRPYTLLNPRNANSGGHNGALSLTQPFGASMVNELRVGVQVYHSFTGPKVVSPPITQTLGLPTYPGTIAWPSFGFGNFDYIDRDNPKDAPNQNISAADNFSWTRGRHEMKFGFLGTNSRENTIEIGQPGGSYDFNGSYTALMDPSKAASGTFDAAIPQTGIALADFLLGQVNEATLNSVPNFHTRQTDYAGFVQDNWKATPRLTLNLGVRYEYWTPFTDSSGKASTLKFNGTNNPIVVYAGSGAPKLDPGVFKAYTDAGLQTQSAAQAGLPSSLWNMPKNNWAPRVGLAYQLSDKTVLRGGYGIYYWTMPLVQYHQNTRHNAPFNFFTNNVLDQGNNTAAELKYNTTTTPGVRDLGNKFINTNVLQVSEGAGWSMLPWDTNYKAQRVQQWNVTAETVLPENWAATLTYVGNVGAHLINYDPINSLVPRALSIPGATDPQRRAYPHYNSSGTGNMDLLGYTGYANSHRMQASVKHIFERQFTLQSFFEWAKTLTTSEGANKSYGGLEMLPAALTNNAPISSRLRSIYAPDSTLPGLTFSVNGHYELPFGHGQRFLAGSNGFVNRLVTGWNTSLFYYWRSGLYFSPYYSTRGSSLILAPGKTGILAPGQRNRKQWFDASIQEIGTPYTGQTFIRRANTLDNDLLNNIPRNYMTGPGFNNMDGSLYKLTPIKEGLVLSIEAQVFNLYNHVNLGTPNNNGVLDKGVGGPFNTNTPRLVQLQGKITF